MDTSGKKTYYCTNRECNARMQVMSTRCPSCQKWNTIKQGVPDTMSTVVVRMSDVDPETGIKISTGMPELDEVLDGGVVRGQVILIAGPPGVGKSTLLLEVADALSKRGSLNLETGKESRKEKNEVLYTTSEEDIEKVSARSRRLKKGEKILICHNKNVAEIESDLAEHQPEFTIIDSCSNLEESGSIQGAIKNLKRIYDFAHNTHTTIFVTAHVNKDDELAGAVALQHCVDTVLMLGRDQESSNIRILRVQKNRHGDEARIGLFEMSEKGLYPYDPTKEIDAKNLEPGQAFGVATIGSKSLIVEVQALVQPAQKPTITALGYDSSRVKMILAALRQRAGVDIPDADIYVQILGGVDFKDPGLDTTVAMAIASAWKKKSLKPLTTYAGEIDLLGRVKGKSEARKAVADKYGFKLVKGDSLSELIDEIGSALKRVG